MSHMNGQSVESRVIEIIHDHLGAPLEKITPQASLVDDLRADSLDMVELTMALEDAFDIEITDEEAKNALLVGDVIAGITKKLGS